MTLVDKVAVVTGAGRGIGRAIALALAKEGAHIVVAALEEPEVLAVCREIQALERRAVPFPFDVTHEAQVQALAHTAEQNFGRVDILVNGAGVWQPVPLTTSTFSEALAGFDAIMSVNVRGAFLCTTAMLPIMIRQHEGHILNISSIGGVTRSGTTIIQYRHGEMFGIACTGGLGARWIRRGGGRTIPPSSPYGTSKFAVLGLTEYLAGELRPHGIRVNALCPSLTETRMTHTVFPGQDISSFLRPDAIAIVAVELVKEGPLGRTGESVLILGMETSS